MGGICAVPEKYSVSKWLDFARPGGLFNVVEDENVTFCKVVWIMTPGQKPAQNHQRDGLDICINCVTY